jgi:hypothetical protein
MCYSEKISIYSYVLGVVVGILIILKNKTHPLNLYAGILVLTYIQVQLAEAIVWRGIDTKNTDLNLLGSRMIIVFLSLQPMATLLGLLLFPKLRNYKCIISCIALFWVCLVIYYCINQYDKIPTTAIGKNCHLNWKFSNIIPTIVWIIYLLIFIGSVFFVPTSLSKKIPFIMIMIGTLLYSIYNFQKYQTVGTMWCYIAVWISIIILLII